MADKKKLNAPTYEVPDEEQEVEITQNVGTQEDLTEENTAIAEAEVQEQQMTENQKNKKFWEELFAKEDPTEEDEAMKAQLKAYHENLMATFADRYSHEGDSPDGKTIRLTDQEDFNAYYSDYYEALAVKHLNGGYDPVDVVKANIDVQREAAQEIMKEDPSMEEACAVYDARAVHIGNTVAAMHEQGKCEFGECKYTDKEGNPIELNWDDEHYEQSLQAVQYGLDHNLIDCTMPDGKKFEVPTNDGYIDNLDYYDSMADKADEFKARTAERAAEKGVTVPDYVKDKEAFEADSQKTYQHDAEMYGGFANGNSRLQVLQQAGLGAEKEKAAEHAAHQASIEQVMSKGEELEGKPQLAIEEKNPSPAYTGTNPQIKEALAKAEAAEKAPEAEAQVEVE